MSIATRVHRTFAVVVFLAWAHLAFGVYPFPSQKGDEIAKLAEDAVAVDRSLRSQGVSEKLLPQTTRDEYITALTSDYWYDWLQRMSFLALGILATVVAYRGYRFWPWVVGFSSAIFATYIGYPMLRHSVGPEHSFSWVTFLGRDALSGGLQLKTLVPIYILVVQPLLHLLIVVACVWVWRKAYAKVA